MYRKMKEGGTVPKFYVIGMGPGVKEYIMPSALRAIEHSEILFGAEKLIAPFTDSESSIEGVPFTGSLNKFLDKLDFHRQKQRAAVLVSGDPGFYSLLGAVKRRFSPNEYEVIPGLAAYQLACARIGLPWQEFRLTSVHGRPMEELDRLGNSDQGVIILTDNRNNPARVSQYLKNLGWKDRTVWVCENISYPEEKIEKYGLGEIPLQKEYKLCLMIISPACGE